MKEKKNNKHPFKGIELGKELTYFKHNNQVPYKMCSPSFGLFSTIFV
jgi:hypothetical protein